MSETGPDGINAAGSLARACDLQSRPGTYALLLFRENAAPIAFGASKTFVAGRGYYVYVGSAFGPGGVRARVSRHARDDKPLHWHIDRLTATSRVLCAAICYDDVRRECEWASVFERSDRTAAVTGFGATDCRCPAHLFFLADADAITAASAALPGSVQWWDCPRGARAAVQG